MRLRDMIAGNHAMRDARGRSKSDDGCFSMLPAMARRITPLSFRKEARESHRARHAVRRVCATTYMLAAARLHGVGIGPSLLAYARQSCFTPHLLIAGRHGHISRHIAMMIFMFDDFSQHFMTRARATLDTPLLLY